MKSRDMQVLFCGHSGQAFQAPGFKCMLEMKWGRFEQKDNKLLFTHKPFSIGFFYSVFNLHKGRKKNVTRMQLRWGRKCLWVFIAFYILWCPCMWERKHGHRCTFQQLQQLRKQAHFAGITVMLTTPGPPSLKGTCMCRTKIYSIWYCTLMQIIVYERNI